MNPLEIMRGRLAELRAKSKSLYDQRGALIDTASTRSTPGLTAEEQAQYDNLTEQRAAVEREIVPVAERLAELEQEAVREQAAASARAEAGEAGEQRGNAQVSEKPIYQRGDRSKSYFRDLANAHAFHGDPSAPDRLQRHARGLEFEQRALGNTNTTGGSGGEFAPPLWMVEDFVKLARAGRITANLYNKQDVPVGVSSVNLPKILTGSSVALQSTQNTALSQTDITTGFVGTGFSTIGGKQIVSQQLIDQSAIDFDQVIMMDLAADYARVMNVNVLTGAGTGANNNSVVNGLFNATVPAGNQITFTSASPTAAAFYSKAAGALASFATLRYDNPTVWLMHPRRWFWLLAQTDSAGRPLVVPIAGSGNVQSFNAMASADAPEYQGYVGNFLGLPVVVDPSLPTNLGAGTNQDRVYLLKQDDLWLFESQPRMEVFRETYADSVGVLFRCYAYVGTILNRQTASIAYVDGTGLTAPTF